jgi:hypothetical protein
MVAVSSLASPVSGGRVGNAGVATSGTSGTRRRAHPLRRRRAAVVVDAVAATHALGVDVGTQGTKAIIYDLSSKTVAGKGSCAYGLLPQPEGRPHFAEQDPEDWLEGIRVAVKQALDDARCDPSAIASVGVSAQQHGMVALDANGALVRPAKLWCDVESSSEAKELAGHFGWDIQAGFTASKVLWMIRNEPNNWSRTKHVLLPHDWINYQAHRGAGDGTRRRIWHRSHGRENSRVRRQSLQLCRSPVQVHVTGPGATGGYDRGGHDGGIAWVAGGARAPRRGG